MDMILRASDHSNYTLVDFFADLLTWPAYQTHPLKLQRQVRSEVMRIMKFLASCKLTRSEILKKKTTLDLEPLFLFVFHFSSSAVPSVYIIGKGSYKKGFIFIHHNGICTSSPRLKPSL